jgi:hypothetical protein
MSGRSNRSHAGGPSPGGHGGGGGGDDLESEVCPSDMSLMRGRGERPKSGRKAYSRPVSSRHGSQPYANNATAAAAAAVARRLEPLEQQQKQSSPAGSSLQGTPFKGGGAGTPLSAAMGATPGSAGSRALARSRALAAFRPRASAAAPAIAEVQTLVPQRALIGDLPLGPTPVAVLLPAGFTGNSDMDQEVALLCVRQFDPACPCPRCDLMQERAIIAAAQAEKLRLAALGLEDSVACEVWEEGLAGEEAREAAALAAAAAAALAAAAAAAATRAAAEAEESAEARRAKLQAKLAAKFDHTAAADALPFKVMLGTQEHGDARDCVTFAHAKLSDAPPSSNSSKLTVFEHIPGSRVYHNMFPIYSLPNGRSCHYYYPGRALVEVVAVALEDPPLKPDSCASISFVFANPDIHTQLSKPSLNKFPLGHKPVPELCSLPLRHTLDVKDDQVRSRDTFGDLKERPFEVEVKENKVIKVTHEILTLPGNFAEPWMLPRSGFKSRMAETDSRDFYDGAATYKSMCDVDWRRVTSKSRIGKFFTASLQGQDVEEGIAECRAVLEKHYSVILQCHRYYAQTSLKGSSFAMNFNAVAEFNTTCKIPDDKSEFATQGHLDGIFVACNVSDGLSGDDVGHNDDANSFDRYEFVEYLLRVADTKYAKDGSVPYLPDALEKLLSDNIKAHANPLALEEANAFRREKVYCEAVDNVLRGADEIAEDQWFDADSKRTYPHGNTSKILSAIYQWGLVKQRGRYKHLMLDTWRQLLLMGQLHKHGFSMRLASYMFIMSQMYVVDEMKHWQRHEALHYVDFLECICRVAEEMNLPVKEHLLEDGYASYHDFCEQRKAAADAAAAGKEPPKKRAARTSVAGAAGAAPPSSEPAPNREVPKEMALHYKLKGFLHFFFESLHASLQGEGGSIKYSPTSLLSMLKSASR